MNQLRNKIVFILSPNKWGSMKVSKHHYALELSKIGAKVYFIEPPSLENKIFEVKSCYDDTKIYIVKYKPIFRGINYLPGFLFNGLVWLQIKIILKKLKVKPDIIFCFHGYLYNNLKWFNSSKNIYFAFDQFESKKLPPELMSSDLIFAVSDSIKKNIENYKKSVVQLNHGLQQTFVEIAEKRKASQHHKTNSNNIIIGYVGNLRMQALNREIMMKVISCHSNIKFIFWGSYEENDLNLGGEKTQEANDFIIFLKNSDNVELRGTVNGLLLSKEILICNLFWICWQTNKHRIWDGSNSHKILEYMATGAPLVTHYVSSYENTELLYMLKSDDDSSKYLDLFNDVLKIIIQGEPKEKIISRLSFAINNSYVNQLRIIDQALTKI